MDLAAPRILLPTVACSTRRGELVLAPHFAAQSVSFELRTASLRKLGLLSGRDWPDEPLELRAKLTQSSDDVVLEDLAGKLGDSDFAGQCRRPREKSQAELRLESGLRAARS